MTAEFDAFYVDILTFQLFYERTLLDNSHTMEDILKKLKEEFNDMPKEGEEDLKDFIQSLVERGLAGYEFKKG